MKKIWERIVLLSKADKSFDIRFWQAQSPTVRFQVAQEMTKDYYKIKGKKITANTFRLRKDIERLIRVDTFTKSKKK